MTCYDLYTTDGQLIGYTEEYPTNFTGKLVADNYTAYLLNGKRHRLGGPSYENDQGDKSYHVNGILHRLDGPACEYSGGKKTYAIHGTECTEKQHSLLVNIMKLKGLI